MRSGDSGTQSEFEGAILAADVQAIILLMAHQANGDHQPVAADLGYQSQLIFQGQAQELKRPALGQVLLELATHGNHLLRGTRIAQQFEEQVDGFRQWREC